MKKLIVIFVLNVLLVTTAVSQNGVSINAAPGVPADNSAMLDIVSSSKGLLIPRVALQSTTDVTTIPMPALSLLVYNTNASMAGGGLGFWYWNGTLWVQAIGPAGPAGPSGPGSSDFFAKSA